MIFYLTYSSPSIVSFFPLFCSAGDQVKFRAKHIQAKSSTSELNLQPFSSPFNMWGSNINMIYFIMTRLQVQF